MLYRFFKKNRQFALFFLALLALGCTEDYTCPIPNIDRFTFNVIMPIHELETAKTQGNGGYKKHGIIVYRFLDADGDVHAFDATCANSAECVENGVVVFDGVGTVTATCRRCRSQYYLRDGKHLQKKVMLRPYIVQHIANTMEQYRVSNY
ncbi:MAG: hypothetical protein LBU92_02085 [Prevotellaceae bacterium]|jgi:nitrite reductase/ring-hydroxylating ferredoxin subunit|nr:hypothetical protein [Prevotellaceae bacterium]